MKRFVLFAPAASTLMAMTRRSFLSFFSEFKRDSSALHAEQEEAKNARAVTPSFFSSTCSVFSSRFTSSREATVSPTAKGFFSPSCFAANEAAANMAMRATAKTALVLFMSVLLSLYFT